MWNTHTHTHTHTPLSWSQSGEEAPLHRLRGPRRGEPHTGSGSPGPQGLADSCPPGPEEESSEGEEERHEEGEGGEEEEEGMSKGVEAEVEGFEEEEEEGGDDGDGEEGMARGEEAAAWGLVSSSELLPWLPSSSIETDTTGTHTHTHIQVSTLNTHTQWITRLRTAALTRQAVGLHGEAGDVLVGPVPLRPDALLPGAHGEGAPLGVDLFGDALQVAQRGAVVGLRGQKFGLTLIHVALELLRGF